MTDQDKELRRLAQAATPGPWKVGQYLGSPRQFVIHMDVGDKGRGSDVAFTSAAFGNDETIANARLIAAANPAAVSELLDRLEAAEIAFEQSDKTCRDLTEKVIPNLRRELEAAERDAARYRFVRTADRIRISTKAARDPVAYDEAIDAAMHKESVS